MTKDNKYWNKKMETLSSEEYFKVQKMALLRELNYVWQKSRFYQEKFGREGIELGDIKEIDDLEKLPFTEKHEIRESLNVAPL